MSPGDRVGHYEILGLLGTGGMGEVYRARDPRLNREVAVKALPAAFADDPARVARFEREAQVLAALNHPNIAAIYGLEAGALVMELVEGETIADRITRGPFLVAEALAIARQIAEALEAAHEKNIVHRDLKPANVKITPDGKVKVLDFGLAKAHDPEPSSSGLTNSPTLTLGATQAGVILGTAGYMSPEQARGKPVDKRADIWSFGVVLFEMLTGRSLFEGETVSDTLAGVLRADLDWKLLPADTPPGVRRLLERCLERDPKRRLRDIGDSWPEMDAIAQPAAATPVAASSSGRRLPWVAAALLAGGLIGAAAVWNWVATRAPAPQAVIRWQAVLPETGTFPAVTLSRDGTRIAYSNGFTGGPFARSHIVVRAVDQLAEQSLASTEGGIVPSFSPDGQWIVFQSLGKIKKAPLNGGPATVLCDVNLVRGMAWGDDGTIVFSAGANEGLQRISVDGGKPELITKLNQEQGEKAHFWPQILAGGTRILFTIATGTSYEAWKPAILDLKTGKHQVVAGGGSMARYVPTGHLVYVRGGSLFALPFDLDGMVPTGPEVPVINGILISRNAGFADYSFAANGLLVYATGSDNSNDILEWTDLKGVALPVSLPPQQYAALRIAPDGQRVAVVIGPPGGRSIWVLESSRGTLMRLTFDGNAEHPTWTPDSRRIAYRTNRTGKETMELVAADGSGKPETLAGLDGRTNPNSFTPDGKSLFYTLQGPKPDLGVLDLAVDGGAPRNRVFLQTAATELQAMASPTGGWVAYQSDESGQFQVYVTSYLAPGPKIQISGQEGGTNPRWSQTGRELFYRDFDSQLWMVRMEGGATLRPGKPERLFKRPLRNSNFYDIAPDGKRVLFIKSEQDANATGTGAVLQVVTNWFDELRRLAPAKR